MKIIILIFIIFLTIIILCDSEKSIYIDKNIKYIYKINNMNNEIIKCNNKMSEILREDYISKRKILNELYRLSIKINELSNFLLDIDEMEEFYIRSNILIINLSMIIEYINNFPEIINNENKDKILKLNILFL